MTLEKVLIKLKNHKSRRRILEEQNDSLKNMVVALNKYTDRAELDNKNTIQITNSRCDLIQNSIPSASDIERIVQERLDLEKKEESFRQQYSQFTPEAQQDIEWTKDFFQVDKYKALDYYVQLFKRFQTRNKTQTEH